MSVVLPVVLPLVLVSSVPQPTAVSRLEPGGSNYIAYFVNEGFLGGCRCSPKNQSNPNWIAWNRSLFTPDGYRHTVGDYHLAPDQVRQQLGEMYGAGQRKISLLLHLSENATDCMDLSSPPPDVCHTTHAYKGDGAWGYVLPLDSTTHQLQLEHQANLRSLLADIRHAGFNQINIRFLTYGRLDPRGWRNGGKANWDPYHEYLYQVYWTALRSVIDSVNQWFPPSDSISILYDLNGEIANYLLQLDGKPWNSPYSYGHTTEHSRRLWADYLKRYGNTRTIGFSFGNRILYPGAKGQDRDVIPVINKLVYDRVGARPAIYAFDMYPLSPGPFSGFTWCGSPCYDQFFAEIARQVRQEPAWHPVILPFESPYNDKQFAKAVQEANEKLGLGIPYVMQWLKEDGPWVSGRKPQFPRDYTNYLRLTKVRS